VPLPPIGALVDRDRVEGEADGDRLLHGRDDEADLAELKRGERGGTELECVPALGELACSGRGTLRYRMWRQAFDKGEGGGF